MIILIAAEGAVRPPFLYNLLMVEADTAFREKCVLSF